MLKRMKDEGNFVGHRGVDIKCFRSFFVDLTTGVDIVKADGSVFGGNMEKSLYTDVNLSAADGDAKDAAFAINDIVEDVTFDFCAGKIRPDMFTDVRDISDGDCTNVAVTVGDDLTVSDTFVEA